MEINKVYIPGMLHPIYCAFENCKVEPIPLMMSIKTDRLALPQQTPIGAGFKLLLIDAYSEDGKPLGRMNVYGSIAFETVTAPEWWASK